MGQAACRSYDTEMFFPLKGAAIGETQDKIDEAKAVCFACPVLEECRDWILETCSRYEDDYGIFGGMTPEDRHRARFDARNERQRERRRQHKKKNSGNQ